MLAKSYPYYLSNKPERPNTDLTVMDKFTGDVATQVAMANVRMRPSLEFHTGFATSVPVKLAPESRTHGRGHSAPGPRPIFGFKYVP